MYRKDEVSQATGLSWRGLAILVRRRIVHQPLPVPTHISLYTLGVELHLGGADLQLHAAYKAPSDFLCPQDLHQLFLAPQVLIAGDFNAKHPAWNSCVGNAAGVKLHDDAEARGYSVVGPEVPTRYPDNTSHTPDVLDIVVHNDIKFKLSLQVLDDSMGSDHLPVLAVLDQDPVRSLARPPRPPTNWRRFRDAMSSNTPSRPITTAAEVNQAAEDLTTAICEALAHATPRSSQDRQLPPLPTHLRTLLREKRLVRRTWQLTRCPQTKFRLNRLRDKIKSELQALSNESWERRIDSAAEGWASAHKLCRQLTNAPTPARPLLHTDGTPRYRAEDRVGIFADYLEGHFTPNPATSHEQGARVAEHLRDYFTTPLLPEDSPIFFSPSQVRRQISKASLGRAPGADGITNTALRHLPPRSVAALARLFTGILRVGAFPDAWKEGRIIMIPKQGKNILRPESYRPITLLSSVSKVFERLVLAHLLPHIAPRPEQFGFRAEHSTTLQLSRVLHRVSSALNRRERAVAVFLDIEKAFDRVWHAGLVFKLSQSTAPRRIVRLIDSFLQGRSFRVALDGTFSDRRPALAGVPQGSCLSPVLYAHYTDDIPIQAGAELALYADDAALISVSLNMKHAVAKLQQALDAIPAWLDRWRLKANAGKTQAIAFPRSHIVLPPLVFLGQEIEWSGTVKYLGVTLDRGLSMYPHVVSTVNRARAARAMLRPILTAASLPLNMRLTVYKTYIRPHLTYAAPAWYALTSESSRRRLHAQQHLALRSVVGAPRYVRNATIQRDLRIESIDAFIRRLATNMFARADVSSLAHIKDIAPWHARPPDHRYILPRDLVEED